MKLKVFGEFCHFRTKARAYRDESVEHASVLVVLILEAFSV